MASEAEKEVQPRDRVDPTPQPQPQIWMLVQRTAPRIDRLAMPKRSGITERQGALPGSPPAAPGEDAEAALPLPRDTLVSIGLPLTMADIKRLYYGGKRSPANFAYMAGLDVDDVFSCILLGLVTRGRLKGRYDADRGHQPSTYVLMVMSSVLRNKLQAASRLKRTMITLGANYDVALGLEYNGFPSPHPSE